ncbi:glycosyl transferase [Rhodococcoides trifolii]|uniref:Glycosyl transferase n=1 Tax=Rhodococcoides trifolii TaxID=908250 RepID=A0A917G3S3_9NOCA|nr:glycosyl transferase [Rhodococcus trifolii]
MAGTRPRVAIAHDYLTQRGGAEKVVLAMARAFPEAPIYTTLYDAAATYPEFGDLDIRVSPLNRVGLLRSNHRVALPFLPHASSMTEIDADVVLTSSSGWAHGFSTTGKKLVYCYSPARWLYQTDVYLGESSGMVKRLLMSALTPALRRWDRRAAHSADRYLAISTAVRERITTTYGIDSTVVPAPFTVDDSAGVEAVPEAAEWLAGSDYYLCVSRLLPYKNVDKVMKAFEGTGRTLVVVGRGPEKDALEAMRLDNVLMLSDLSEGQMSWLYQNTSGLVAASYEDYGLTPLEAGHHGKPSIVLRWGGFLDTISENVTGIFFDEPEPQAISAAIDRCESRSWDSARIVGHVQQFGEDRFAERLADTIDDLLGSESSTRVGALPT